MVRYFRGQSTVIWNMLMHAHWKKKKQNMWDVSIFQGKLMTSSTTEQENKFPTDAVSNKLSQINHYPYVQNFAANMWLKFVASDYKQCYLNPLTFSILNSLYYWSRCHHTMI